MSFSINVRAGLWVCDLKLGVKLGLKAAVALKPESIGLDAFDAEISPRDLSLSGRRDLARHARNIAPLAAVRADLGGRRLADKQFLDANLTRLRDAFQLAADLGVPRVLLPAGFVPEDSKDNVVVRDTLMEGARAVVNIASMSGVRICWQAGGEAPATLAAFLDRVDSSGMLEVDLNPGAFLMRDVDPLNALNTLSSRVTMARISDHYRGGAEAPFGRGDVRWGEVLVGLASLSRNHPIDLMAACALDGDRIAALTRIVARLKELRANPV